MNVLSPKIIKTVHDTAVIPFFREMLHIENSRPEVYEKLLNGNFVAQLSETNPLRKIKLDKVIEVTINRNTKTSGDTTCFSRSKDAVNRWNLNAPYKADVRRCLHEMLQVDKKTTIQSDLTAGRIKRDLEDVRAVTEILTETFIHPFTNNPLLCISNGAVTTNEGSSDFSKE